MKDLRLLSVPRFCVAKAAQGLKDIATTAWKNKFARQRNSRRRHQQVPGRLQAVGRLQVAGRLLVLEPRLLLSVTQFSVDAESIGSNGSTPVFSWQSHSDHADASVELWVDQIVTAADRNSRVLYVPEIDSAIAATQDNQTHSFRSTHALPFGNYIAWLREHSTDTVSAWKRVDFQLDDDGDSQTDLPDVDSPAAATPSVIREGQGFAAHELSESRIAWTTDELLHDVWVNQRQPNGHWAVYRKIRNVPGRSISFSDIQSAAQTTTGFSYFGQIADESSVSMESGDYRFFVRSVNAATNETGEWAGRGQWSSGVDFSYTKIEDEAARPETLTVTHQLSPSISWTAVANAEYYLVSLWKGPNYAANRPLIFRSHQANLQPTAGVFRDGDREIVIEPGDEIFVKVRAVGQDGTSELFTPTNHVSTTIRIPGVSSVQASRPDITSPAILSGNQPLLAWNDVPNAESYEVWMSSIDDHERIFLATDIRSSRFLLSPSALQTLAVSNLELSSRIDEGGLRAGRYRFWVRAHSPIFVDQSAWSTASDFEIVSNSTLELNLDAETPLANRPLVAPNLAIPFEDQGRSFLLFSNGKGESFGASVLAKYEVNSDGSLQRPVIDGSDKLDQLEFPDLPMGTNVSDMKRLSDGRIVVLSRGSSELRIVDPVTWQVDATYSLVADQASEYPDAIGLEVLSNNQIAVVFNRSDRLRIFDITGDGLALVEINDSGNNSEAGFVLTAGRGVQISAIQTGDATSRFFVATPGQAAVVVYDYDSVERSLVLVADDSGSTAFIRRSPVANPFHGGTMASIQEQGNGTSTDYYFSADRSGFLTWVHPQTLQHGFIDLANWMPSVDRNTESKTYANPNDNSFDTTRILPLDDSRLVVLNSRQESVLLQLALQPDGQVTAIAGSELPRGYGGASLKLNGAEFIVTTAVAPFSRNRQTSEVASTELSRGNDDDQAAMIPATPIVTVLANPIVAAGRFHEGLILQKSDGSVYQVRADSTKSGLETRSLGTTISNQQGNEYVLTPDLFSTFQSEEFGQDFLFVSAVLRSDSFSDSAPVLLLLEITEVTGLKFVKALPVGELKQPQSLSISESTVVILDRFGGQMHRIRDWKSDTPEIEPVYDFGQQHPTNMGAIRPANSVILDDDSIVVVHDTFPDRGISVLPPNNSRDNLASPVFHANTTGTFSFDLHTFDQDRVITASYRGDIVVFDVETGAWELDTPINDLNQSATTFAVENSSYHRNHLVINSPSAQTVTALKVTENQEGLSIDIIGTHTATDAISTVADDDGYWIVGTGRVQRIFTAKA